MKSFFCFKDKKIKLINLCNDIVQKDICVERILKRLYTLENNYYNLIFEKNNDNINESNLNEDFTKIKKWLYDLNSNCDIMMKYINTSEDGLNISYSTIGTALICSEIYIGKSLFAFIHKSKIKSFNSL